MHLVDVEDNAWVRIGGFERAIQKAMAQYGLFPGDVARVVRRAPLGGPLLVEVNEREIALGRGVAEKILVEPV